MGRWVSLCGRMGCILGKVDGDGVGHGLFGVIPYSELGSVKTSTHPIISFW